MANWDLFREMENLRREFDQAFQGSGFNRLLDPAFMPGLGARRYPRINLREDQDHLYVDALLPGVEPKELEMTVLRGTLTLAGERKAVDGEKVAETWHRRERGIGKFLRTVELPVEVDVDRIEAGYKNGLLTVTLPKAEAAKPKKIAVKVG